MQRNKMQGVRGVLRIVVVVAFIALFVSLVLAPPARAEVIEVPCQLSATLPLAQAIEEANATPGADTIALESACTYGLFGAYVYDEGQNGLPAITDELTIEGNGARLERMGSQRFRLLKATELGALTIRNLTLANGYAIDPNNPHARGGAIHTRGDLILENVTISGSYAGGNGGGVFATGGFVKEVTVTDSRFEDNQSLNSGGGFYAEEEDVVMHRVEFLGNEAERYGGGAYTDSASIFVYDGYFEGNQVNLEGARGGGLAVTGGDLFLHYSDFLQNNTPNGIAGALYVAADATVSNTRFESNAALEGGAIYTGAIRMTLTKSTFLNNFAVARATDLYLRMSGNDTSIIANNLWVGQQSPQGTPPIRIDTVAADPNSTLAFVYYNTIADPQDLSDAGILVVAGRAQVVNNIIAGYTSGLLTRSSAVNAGYNLYEIADPAQAQVGEIVPFGEGTILLSDPHFVGRAAGDYRLQPDSGAIDQAYDVGYEGDIAGTARPQGDGFDIGAYEYVPQNTPPSAVDDSYVTVQDTPLVIAAPGVLDNDVDEDREDLTAVLESPPQHGGITLNADGSFTYTPDDGYVGQDSFSYAADDGLATSNDATVTITMEQADLNVPPVAIGDSYQTEQDKMLTVPEPGVLENDVDANGDALTAVLVADVAHGQLALQADGSFVYTADAGYVGGDSFVYQAQDSQNASAEATVRIEVLAEEAPWTDFLFLPVFRR